METRNQVVEDAIARNESCPICHTGITRGESRVICTALIAARGSSGDPRMLRKNYMRCTVVCCEACEALALMRPDTTSFDRAIRIIAECRAADEKCDITTFPSISNTELISTIIANEILIRIEILIAQTKGDGHARVSGVLEDLYHIVDAYFNDRGAVINFESPFKPETDDARIFDRALAVFAINESREARTFFERAIIDQAIYQMHKVAQPWSAEVGDHGCSRIIFPIRIAHANMPGEKTCIRVGMDTVPSYVF
jgi:hypothetical protein